MALILQFISLAIFAFGAPAFSVLAFSYWRQRGSADPLLRAFTVVCALSFLANLISTAVFIDYSVVQTLRAVLAALVPPMMLHLVLKRDAGTRTARIVSQLVWLLYAVSALCASGLLRASRFTEDLSPALFLCTASVLSILVLLANRRRIAQADRTQDLWNLVLFALLLGAGIGTLVADNPIYSLAPDYLILLFFAVRLYYAERLAFFDTFLRVGAFFAAGTILFAATLLLAPPFRSAFADEWFSAWVGILVLMPAWLLAPFLYRAFNHWMDRALDRKYSAIEAERLFSKSVQTAQDEQQLCAMAKSTLSTIFSCDVEVAFDIAPEAASCGDATHLLKPQGFIRLLARKNGVPFLGDDHRLLETLAETLSMLLQNMRLRVAQQRQAQREQQLSALAERAELRALRAQINPHFLFNALNAIAGWIRTEPEFADETIAQLAEVFRYTLHRSEHEWVRVSEEIEFIRAYLAVEHARFRNRIEFRIDVATETGNLQIPAMCIQPLVENAVKHGASQVNGQGRLTVTVGRDAGRIHIRVIDNGPGFPDGFSLSSAEGHGLKNVKNRLSGYYGDAAQLMWSNTADGCEVTIEIPERDGAPCAF